MAMILSISYVCPYIVCILFIIVSDDQLFSVSFICHFFNFLKVTAFFIAAMFYNSFDIVLRMHD